MLSSTVLIAGYLASRAAAAAVTFAVPPAVPEGAANLDPTPIGVSFEFDQWPAYSSNFTLSQQCLSHFTDIYGKKLPVRVGGTTQDGATYDANLDVPLRMGDVTLTSTFGPGFFDLIAKFGAETTLGFNRGNNNITNTIEAVVAAKSKIQNYLWSIELGNEPDIYLSTWNKPVAVAPWNESQEGANAAEWIKATMDVWENPMPIISAGVYAVPIPLQPAYPNTNYLITDAFNDTVQSAVKTYCGHSYALSGNVTELAPEMHHAKTVSDLSHFVDKIATAKTVNKTYILGEAGFHGILNEMDATFGGAIQLLDKSLRAASIDLKRMHYHQGGILNRDPFNWWSIGQVEAPFYGGYMSALALSGGDHIVASDNGDTAYAQYVVYKGGAPVKVILVNTDYYSGASGDTRNSTSFTLTGLQRDDVSAIRMTAASSEVRAGSGQQDAITIGGQYFSNQDCAQVGETRSENATVAGGSVTFTLAASEAVLVYL